MVKKMGESTDDHTNLAIYSCSLDDGTWRAKSLFCLFMLVDDGTWPAKSLFCSFLLMMKAWVLIKRDTHRHQHATCDNVPQHFLKKQTTLYQPRLP